MLEYLNSNVYIGSTHHNLMVSHPPTNYDSDDSNLAYDLRQRYANLVAVHLERIASSRFIKNYPEYFSCLEDLYTVVEHKIKEDKNKTNKKDIISYDNLKKSFFDLASKNAEAYLGRSKSPEQVLKIENILRKMERYLYRVMDEANMFGSIRDDAGL